MARLLQKEYEASRRRDCACCSAGSLDTLTVLEEHKVDVNIAAHGVTALHAAAEAGELECAQILLKVSPSLQTLPALPCPQQSIIAPDPNCWPMLLRHCHFS